MDTIKSLEKSTFGLKNLIVEWYIVDRYMDSSKDACDMCGYLSPYVVLKKCACGQKQFCDSLCGCTYPSHTLAKCD